MALTLSSPAFEDGEPIPKEYSCQGADRSVPLAWSGAPPGTRSLVLVCTDSDAPLGTFQHWAIYNLPAEADHLDEGLPKAETVGVMRQAVNDFGRWGYGGPCPPPGHGVHHYHFRLFALRTESLRFPGRPHCKDVEAACRPHILAETELVGTYTR